jgi:hypothetical protein
MLSSRRERARWGEGLRREACGCCEGARGAGGTAWVCAELLLRPHALVAGSVVPMWSGGG